MIANSTELRVAIRQLRIMETGLQSLREQLQASNPKLLEVAAKAYLRRIASLQEEIAQYFAGHPADVSLVLPPLEKIEGMVAAPASPA